MLCEAMLASAGRITRMGNIASGTTASDYHPSEKQHQISVHSTLLNLEWMGRKFNIIDSPGCADFISEGLSALRVGDFALLTINASHGLGYGTDASWEYATSYGLPKMLVVTALDKPNVNFDALIDSAREHFGQKVFPLTIPINAGPGFNQLLDVMRSELITFKPGGDGHYDEKPVTGALLSQVQQLHKQLIELVAEADDKLLEHYFEEGSLSEEELRAYLHKAIQGQLLIPLFAVSAETNVGVARMMDLIAKYGSSPLDRAEVPAKDATDADVTVPLTKPEPVLHVFKTMNEPGAGELSLFRVYSGRVKSGEELVNSDRGSTERIGQIYVINGSERVAVPFLNAGDLGAVVKLRDTHTGNTLCSPRYLVRLAKVDYPKPNIHGALKLKSKGDEDKLATGLAMLHEEDPTFIYRVDDEIHQTIVSGQGEIHLQIIVERLTRRFGVHVELEEPRIPYRETIRGSADSKYRHKKQTGGAGQFAEVWMKVEPATRDSGVVFEQNLVGTNVDRTFVPSVEKGVKAACTEGILAGFRVVDVKANFYDGKMHPVDSKDIAFQIAGYFAFREAFQNARPCLLEPIHELEIKVPEEFVGRVVGDLSSRRGKILGMDVNGHFQSVRAQVPAAQLYHYGTALRSLTGGRGLHSEKFSHYEEMQPETEKKIVADYQAARATGNHGTHRA